MFLLGNPQNTSWDGGNSTKTSTQHYLQYLAISATSASSERLFSSAKQLITDQRNRLDEDRIEIVECLKSWIGQV
jgi:hypothetical protein